MPQRHKFLIPVVAGALVVSLIGACAAPLVRPADRAQSVPTTEQTTVQAGDSRPATTAPVEATPYPQGTPPGFPTIVVEQVVSDPLVIALLAGLQRRGYLIERQDASRVELLTDAPGQSYRLGEGWLFLHIYANAQAAQAKAASLPDAIEHSMGDWVAPPHFFQCDRLVVLFLGAGERVISTLVDLCAPPFYTTNLTAPAPAATHAPLTTIEAALAWLIAVGEPNHATSVPDVRVTVQLKSGRALLYTYEALQAGKPVLLTRFSYLDWRDPVWYPDGDQIQIAGDRAELPPIQFLTGSYAIGSDTRQVSNRVTFAGGQVNDPAIMTVRVIFSDDLPEVVPVEHEAYLAARLDVERVVSIEARDQAGQTIYQFNTSP